MAYIPNYEVGTAFQSAIITGDWGNMTKILERCNEILTATILKDSDTVGEILDISHSEYTSILKYNYENSLSCAITMSYFTAQPIIM